ncbi:membrane protein [Xenorhabdus khoisanae]|uniref:Membrane protein n=1 Tax=Xenorhabdus khoisanae TaxID=880157 RepID=A0A0J5FPE2_9GAMM|nr:DUF2165 family protein [Xenorhabdus khoisanae]KMJ43974.1 membrane protein [Xenorhabdus khoisanae]
MDPVTGINLFKALHAFGIAGWATIAMINNGRSFTMTAGTVGRMMSMELLKQEPPVNTPLLSRATTSRVIHRAALTVIVVLQILTAISMWISGYLLLMKTASHPETLLWLNVGIICFATCAFILLLGGLWYGYWIRQEGLQITHIAIVIWSIAAFLLFHSNLASGLTGDI